ncbi:uncharacterized protein LOC116065008 [Sander lucioperca]|uniref:uncharacterized protein LOC116065008 n=1 Tax=Sander lucioperca TaxID=283035 RepID=UPI001653A549|nr:uncharacterized protein LOC116065008 [Sander lucioperca]
MPKARQNTTSSTMDKETENMEEFIDILVSKVIEHSAANLSELMLSISHWDAEECITTEDDKDKSSAGCLTQQKVQQHLDRFFTKRRLFAEHCGDILEDKEVTCPSISPTKEKIMTNSSSSTSCQSCPYPESLEKQAKAAKMLISQVIDDHHKQSIEALRKLHTTDSASKTEKPAGKSYVKKLKSAWKRRFGRKKSNRVKPVSEQHVDQANKDSADSSKQDLRSTCLELVEKEEDSIETEMRNLPSPASSSSFPSPDQVEEKAQPESHALVETATVFQEELRSWKSTDSCDGVLRAAADTEGEVSTPDLADSCCQAFQETYIPTSTAQTVQTLPIEGQEEVVSTPHTTNSASKTKKTAGKSFVKKLKSAWKSRFGRRKSNRVKPVSAQHVDQANKDSEASSKQDLISTCLELVEKEEDSIEMEMRNLPSPASSSSFPSPNQVDEDAQPESHALVETATVFQEELRSWKSTDSCDGVLRAAADTEGEVSTPDLADSCCQAFQETYIPTSTAQTVQTLPIEGQEEVVSTPHTTNSASKTKKTAGKSFVKKLKSAWKRRFGRKKSNRVKPVSAQHVDQANKDSEASSKQDLISTCLELVEKEEDSIETEMRNLPSPASSSSFPSPDQVEEKAQPESHALVETATVFQEELRSWKSTDSCDGVLRAAADTEGEVSTPDLADSCCQAFQETYIPTSTAQTVQTLPIEGQEEVVSTPHTTNSASKTKKTAGKSFVKKLKSAWKSRFGRRKSNRVKPVSAQHVDQANKDSEASSKQDLISTCLELVEKEEDSIEMEMRNLPSPASSSSFPSPDQVEEKAQPESHALVETATVFQEELRSWKSTDSCDGVLRAAADTEWEVSTPDLADSCCQAFQETYIPTSTAQTVQTLPIEGQEEVVSTPHTTNSASKTKKTAGKSFVKKLKSAWKRRFGRKKSNRVKLVSAQHVDQANKDSEASSKQDLISTCLELVEKEEDSIETEMRNLPSPASSSSFPSPDQVEEKAQPESHALVETATVFQEELRSWKSTDSCDGVLRAAADTEGEVSTPDLADSCCQAFQETYIPTSTAQTVQTLPIEGQEEVVSTPHTTNSASKTKKTAGKSFVKKLKSAWKSRFGRRKSNRVKPVSAQHVDQANKDSEASSKQDLISTCLELVEKEEDSIEMEMRNLPSPASSSSFPSPDQVEEKAQPESQQMAETATVFQEELRSWKSTDSCDGVLRAAADTEGEVSTPDLADSCCQAFQETSIPTSTAQTVQALLIEGQEEYEKTETGRETTQSPLNQKISEKEAEDFRESEDIWIPETGSTFRLSSRPEENRRATSSAFCSCTTSAMFEVANMIDGQVIEKAIRTLESIDSDGKAESPASKTFFKNIRTAWKKRFGKKQRKKITTVSDYHKGQKEQDEAPAEHQMSFGLQQLFAEPLEVKPSEADNDLVMTIYLPPEKSEEDGHSVFSKEENKAAADQLLVLDSSTISAIIRRFFQSLREEQWREVSEGVYNQDVKEQLIYMCTDVLRFISDSVIKIVLQSMCQLSATSGTLTLRRPLSSKHLMEYFNYNFQSSLESSFSQAFCEIIGSDIPVRISHKFTEAIVGEVIEEVNSAISVAIQASLDGGFSSATVLASCQMSKDRAAKKSLAGAIATMKSFLTGRGTAVKRRIQTKSGVDPDVKEVSTKKKESLWKRFFSGRQRKVQSVAVEDLNGAARSASADLTSTYTLEKQQLSWFLRESSTSSPSAALKTDLWSTPLELVDYVEVEDTLDTLEDTRNVISSLSSISSIPLDHQVFEVTRPKFLEDTPLSTDGLQDEMNTSSQSPSDDSGDKETFIQISASRCLSVKENKAKERNGFCGFFCNIFSKKEKKEEKKKEEEKIKTPLWMQLFCFPPPNF